MFQKNILVNRFNELGNSGGLRGLDRILGIGLRKALRGILRTHVSRRNMGAPGVGDGAASVVCKKLQGGRDEWRIRVGDYLVVYTVDDAKQLVSVTRIRHRGEVYEG